MHQSLSLSIRLPSRSNRSLWIEVENNLPILSLVRTFSKYMIASLIYSSEEVYQGQVRAWLHSLNKTMLGFRVTVSQSGLLNLISKGQPFLLEQIRARFTNTKFKDSKLMLQRLLKYQGLRTLLGLKFCTVCTIMDKKILKMSWLRMSLARDF